MCVRERHKQNDENDDWQFCTDPDMKTNNDFVTCCKKNDNKRVKRICGKYEEETKIKDDNKA